METPDTTPRSASSRNTTACVACHRRKIKCDGLSPKCSHCLRRGLRCEPHFRTRKACVSVEEERALRQRIAWLEEELSLACGLSADELRQVSTGERVVHAVSTTSSPNEITSPNQSNRKSNAVEKEVGDIAANMAVLSLNATGEMRFMGGTSGVLFSRLIASTVKKCIQEGLESVNEVPQKRHTGHSQEYDATQNIFDWVEGTSTTFGISLSWETTQDLFKVYVQWVHTTYPIFHVSKIEDTIRMVHQEPLTASPAQQTIYHLVMAIGAWHKLHSQDDQGLPSTYPAELFNLAILWVDRVLPLDGIEGLQIVLLLAIYSSYRPAGSSQWHLLGIAMRMCIDMGLHRHNPDWNFPPVEWDIRRRLFWVTYALDRTVCFNLGRPLTLSDDHIDALFPDPIFQDENGPSIALAVHHIHLRRIQTRIISEIYTVGKSHSFTPCPQRTQILISIQSELDQWRTELSSVYSPDDTPHSFLWYERLYYTTTASIYRATPLFPHPSEDSIRRCYEASTSAVRTYYTLLRSNEMGHSWIFVSGCFLSGITILYALWSSDALSQSVQLEEVTECCRMCSNVLAVLSAKWKASGDFSDTYESLTTITIKRLVRQLQLKYVSMVEGSGSIAGNEIYPAPDQILPVDPGLSTLDSLSWPQDFNFHSVLTNPDCITDVFDDLLREQWSSWEVT